MGSSLAHLTEQAQQALLLTVALSLPVVIAAALVGLVTSLLQAVTQVHDQSITHLGRFLAVVLVLSVAGPWMGRQVASFATRALLGG